MHLPAKSSFAITSFAVIVAMVAALACGKTKSEELPLSETTTTSAAVRAVASCDTIQAVGSCSEYSSASASFGVERSLCRGQGEFSTRACPTTGRIGSCELSDNEVKRYYAGGAHGYTADAARSDCEENGVKARFLATR